MTLDNTEYVGLDEEILGDGTSDDTTRPLSEFVERQYDTNNEYLKSRDWKVCYNPYQPNKDNVSRSSTIPVNMRRLSHLFSEYGLFVDSQNRSYPGFLFSIPIYIYPDTQNFRITMRGEINSAQDFTGSKIAGNAGSVNDLAREVRAHAFITEGHSPIVPRDNQSIGSKAIEWKKNENPVRRISVSPETKIYEETAACLQIAIHTNWQYNAFSATQGSISTSPNAVRNLRNRVISFKNISGGLDQIEVENFIKAMSEDQVLLIANDVTGRHFKTMYAGLDDLVMGTSSDFISDALAKPYNAVKRRYINSIAPFSWVFESFSDKTTNAKGFVSKQKESMYSNRTVHGKEVFQQAKNLDYNYTKPRLKAIGPKGGHGSTGTVERSWDRPGSREEHKHRRWRWVRLDNAASGGLPTSRFDNLTCRVDKGTATFRIVTQYALVSFWGILSASFSDNGSLITGRFGTNVEDNPDASALRIESDADITFGYQLRQRGSTAANEVITESTKKEGGQSVFVASFSNKFPLLRTVLDAFWTGPDGTDNFDNFSFDQRNADWNHTMREGILDSTDINAIVQTTTHEIEVPAPSNADIDHSRPVQVISYVDSASNFQAEYTDDAGTTEQHPKNRIALVNLGSTVWEVPA